MRFTKQKTRAHGGLSNPIYRIDSHLKLYQNAFLREFQDKSKKNREDTSYAEQVIKKSW